MSVAGFTAKIHGYLLVGKPHGALQIEAVGRLDHGHDHRSHLFVGDEDWLERERRVVFDFGVAQARSNSRASAARGRRSCLCRTPCQIFLSQTRQTLSAFASATTGPCKTGNGGVFLSLCNMMSNARQTPLPSNLTSIEDMTNSALPLILFDATPPPALPASSPVLMLKFESLTQTGLPSHLTFVVPFAVSDDFAMFGYGIGIGPAGEGVLQTSGKAIVVPLLDAWTTERKLTPTAPTRATSGQVS